MSWNPVPFILAKSRIPEHAEAKSPEIHGKPVFQCVLIWYRIPWFLSWIPGLATKLVVLAVPESMTKAGHIQTGLN